MSQPSHLQPTASSTASHSSSAAPLPSSNTLGSVAWDDDVADVGDRGESETVDEVFMALEMQSSGAVGCAYYTSISQELYLQEDTRITGLELVESLLLQVHPTIVIVPSRSPESFVEFLERQSNTEDVGQEYESSRGFELRTAVSSDFNADSGKELLTKLRMRHSQEHSADHFTTATENTILPDQDYGFDEAQHERYRRNGFLRLGTFVNLESRITLGCVNALMRYLEQHLNETWSAGRVQSIHMVTYKDCMFVAADTVLALQIFRSNSRRAAGKALALFDLFRNLIATPQGHARLREIFLQPSTDLSIIRGRQKAISCILDVDDSEIATSIRSCLGKVRDVRLSIQHLRKGILLPGSRFIKHSAWANLRAFFQRSSMLAHLVSQISRDSRVIANVFSNVPSEGLSKLAERIGNVIDFENSKTSGYTVVADGVSSELDHFRRIYDRLQSRLKQICVGYCSKFPGGLSESAIQCIYHPHTAYLVVTSVDPRTLGIGSLSQPSSHRLDCSNWEEVMQEDGLVYFKTPEMKELDSQYGNLAGQIIKLEVKILHSLGMKVLNHENAIFCASKAVGELDCLMALARGAKKFHLCQPHMTEKNIVEIEEGRYLLQELNSKGGVIPNNCRLAGGEGSDGAGNTAAVISPPPAKSRAPSTIVLTGPNQSGKSIYLKQVAMIVYLAHVGSFVPATRARIGITDRILSRITTRESVSRDESAFGVDLRQALFAINFSTRQSLILIDEFGKGTNEVDGAAVFYALLDHFLQIGHAKAPKVLAATHFHEILNNSGLRGHPCLQLAHMNVRLEPQAAQLEDKVKFLYELQNGHSTDSFGCHCAAINGVDLAVVDRANRVIESLTRRRRLETICLELPASEMEELLQDEIRAQQFTSLMDRLEGEDDEEGIEEEAMRQKRRRLRDILLHVLSSETC